MENSVSIKYTMYEPKKGSVRLSTKERMGSQYPLPDIYVPRSVLTKLGLSNAMQNDVALEITITYSL